MSPESLPFISVIVAALPGEESLEWCLASLANLDYPLHHHEIVVVRADGGISEARNSGVSQSRGEIVAFTDPDCSVSTGWLRSLAEAFADKAVDVVAGGIVPFPPRTLVEAFACERRTHSQERALRNPERPFAMTPNLAVRRSLIEKVGGFDPAFPGGGFEDADLCWRLARHSGSRLLHVPEACVFHRYRATMWEFLKQHHRYGYGLALLKRKYAEELSWGWREMFRPETGLARRSGDLIACLVRAVMLAGSRRSLVFSYCELLRHLGQQSGFLRGALLARPEYEEW